MEFKLVSLKTIIYKAVRDLGLGDREIPWQDMLEWGIEALQQIDAFTQYIEVRGFEVEIDDYIGKLPENFYTFTENPGLVYRQQGDSIVVNTRKGKVAINYLAFPYDEEGIVMIPDNISFAEALMWKIANKLAIRGQLPNKELSIQYTQQMWNRYCGQARSKANSMSIDQLERFAKNRLTFKPDVMQYDKNFRVVGNPFNNK